METPPSTPPTPGSSTPPLSPSQSPPKQDFEKESADNQAPSVIHVQFAPPTPEASTRKMPIRRRGVKRRRQPVCTASIHLLEEIQKTRALSEEEAQALKRQKRLIKNRESAQKSRERRKKYISDLETKVSTLTHKLETVTTERDFFRTQTADLQQTIDYLNDVIENSPGVPQSVLQRIKDRRAAKQSRLISSSLKTAGVTCLMIFLFSFGLFFTTATGPPSKFGAPVFPRTEIPTVVSESGQYSRMFKAYSESSTETPTKPSRKIGPTRNQSPFLAKLMQKMQLDPPLQTQSSDGGDIAVVKKERKPLAHKIKLMTTTIPNENISLLNEDDDESDSTLDLDRVDMSTGLVPAHKLTRNSAEPTVIFCPSAREVVSLGETDMSENTLMSFLIPLDDNNSFSIESETPILPHSVLELSCMIQDVNIYISNQNEKASPTAQPFSIVVPSNR
eukprot:TRINITY_DN13921_c0_g1_i1.p1 TRINITY_DN13921_c0_g1~~TRINITY_DN13921_c0_g1_i1.p1  ORF type:complete len:476 (-),score=68.25 TRINITY_DN13921_c0_g1_i1:21-1364(-)